MLARGSWRAAAFFSPAFNSFNRPSKFQCSAPLVLTAPVGKTVQFFQDDFALGQGAEDEPAAVGAEIASEIMMWA